MTLVEHLKFLDAKMESTGVECVNHTDDFGKSFRVSRQHTRWMINELITGIQDGTMDEGKINRWLGFIQGVMCVLLYITINDEREAIREIENDGQERRKEAPKKDTKPRKGSESPKRKDGNKARSDGPKHSSKVVSKDKRTGKRPSK